MKRLTFRARLFIVLALFAVLPSVVLTLIWAGSIRSALPLISGSAAWDSVAATGERALAAARQAPLSPEARAAMNAHEQELRSSLEQAKRFQYVAPRAIRIIAVLGLVGVMAIAIIASRVAGHLSRQLSRPVNELIGWAERIARGEPLPVSAPRRGAPEFEVLRERLRRTARELEESRAKALEAERLSAFRETARQIAHELKNPLTPIRFAVARLRRDVSPELSETVEVLATESERLERMAKSFAQFGRLPEGPAAGVDLGELARYTAKATVPPHMPLDVQVEENLPMVRGHHDALARALSNILINAVEACSDGGEIGVRVSRTPGRPAVEISVRDSGCGIAPEHLSRIWEPYVTHKPGGTGLGLAIARQTIVAHQGSVNATSSVGAGTEIRFVLPVNEQDRTGDSNEQSG